MLSHFHLRGDIIGQKVKLLRYEGPYPSGIQEGTDWTIEAVGFTDGGYWLLLKNYDNEIRQINLQQWKVRYIDG